MAAAEALSMPPPTATTAHRKRPRVIEDDAASVAASAAPSSVFVPDPCPMRKIPENVLQEEEYTDAVGAIIERDFFPDLPQLRVKRDMLEALAAGEEDIARDLGWKLANMTRPTPSSAAAMTPRPTPRPTPGDSTPLPSSGDTTPAAGEGGAPAGARDARPSAWERDDDTESLATRSADNPHVTRLKLADGKEVNVDLSHVRLDDFQRVFTSEDNASFEQIVARDKDRRRHYQWWIEGPEKVHNTICRDQERQLTNGEYLEGGTISYARHQGRHPISFVPHGQPQPDKEKPPVEFKNTRFTSKQQVELDCMLAAGMASRKARLDGERLENAFETAAKEGKFELPSITAPAVRALGGRLQSPLAGQKPEMNGYPLLKTPTLLPGADGLSPLMTYGAVASTPRLLEDETRGPNFHIVEQSPRELAAEKLQRGATQRLRESKQLTKAERLRALGISTPSTPGRSTPESLHSSVGSKVAPLSPIGQLIHRAQKMAQKGGQLRISSGRSSRPSSSGPPPKKRARADKDRPAAAKLPTSITDDLL